MVPGPLGCLYCHDTLGRGDAIFLGRVSPLVYRLWSSVRLQEWFHGWFPASVIIVGEGVSLVEAWYTMCLEIEDTLASCRRAADGFHVSVADVVKSCAGGVLHCALGLLCPSCCGPLTLQSDCWCVGCLDSEWTCSAGDAPQSDIVDTHRNIVEARSFWYPVVAERHRFMIAVFRVNHDGGRKGRPCCNCSGSWGIVKTEQVRDDVGDDAMPGPRGFWSASWISSVKQLLLMLLTVFTA